MPINRRRPSAILLSLLLLCGTTLVQAADTPAPASPTLSITGELSYLARIALPPETIAIVELSDPSVPGGRVVTEQRIALEGRQVPIPFQLQVERGALEPEQAGEIRAVLLADALVIWRLDPRGIDMAADAIDLGTLVLRQEAPIVLDQTLVCGDRRIRVGFDDARMRLEADGRAFDLRQALSASGARYVALADPTTSFWSKGDGGQLELAGTSAPECVPVATTEALFRAIGHEPSWSLEMDDTRMELVTDFGETRISVALTEPEPIEGGWRYAGLIEDGDLQISLLDRVCVDSMSGMPHPRAVRVVLDDQTFEGCGGDPGLLLRGDDWVVEDIDGGGIIDDSRVTLGFEDAGRFAGRASCNPYLGDYTLTGEGLRLTLSATTLMA